MIILTDDERTILMIADKGESMMPIGRWQQPVEHLVELGYLHRHDTFNNTITEAGRLVLNDEMDVIDDDAARAIIATHNAKVTYRQAGNTIAEQLVELAKQAAESTGDEVLVALQKCVSAVRDRAIDLLK